MVVLSESYLQNYEKNAIELALRFDIAPKIFRRYIDDSHVRFGSRSNATHFQIFFIVKTRRYAIKYENEHKELKFLDVTKKNNLNQSYDFAVFFFLLIHCKFMCCSQHFTTYLLSLQNILFFD